MNRFLHLDEYGGAAGQLYANINYGLIAVATNAATTSWSILVDKLARSDSQTFKYIGQPYDSATGLYLFGARYYDPTIGRFITQDTYGGSLSDPLSLNMYAYAEDNPMTLSDPTGHDWWNPFTWSAKDQMTAALIVISAALIIGSFGLDAPAVLSADAVTLGTIGAGTAAAAVTAAAEENPEGLDNVISDFGSMGESAVRAIVGGEANHEITSIAGKVVPDSLVSDEGAMFEIKVGLRPIEDVLPQMESYVQAITEGKANSITYYFLRSPITGLVGPAPGVLDALKAYGINYFVWDYQWWLGGE
ncbi:MAG: RHS repeat-associated core domain-containing protein [Nitrososphaerales archaeon]